MKLPGVLVQAALVLQLSASVAHSSISEVIKVVRMCAANLKGNSTAIKFYFQLARGHKYPEKR